jgi:predicted NBD/HSP70 family sugar kinase
MWTTLRRTPRNTGEPTNTMVLRLVRDSHAISRTEIAHRCALSKPTVSGIVNRFLRDGFLERVGEASASGRGGRRRELLRFNPRAGCVVGVEVRMTGATVALTDLNAAILHRATIAFRAGSSPASVLRRIGSVIDGFFALDRRLVDRCVGIGIGLPGVVDNRAGALRLADTLAGWARFPIREHFASRYGVPVYLENDVKARSLAEFLFGAGKGVPDQVFLWIGDGIGAGIIIGGRLHHGVTGSAGEVGYNELGLCAERRGRLPMLYDGQEDFGDILSDAVILRRFAARARRRAEDMTIPLLFAEAERGHRSAAKILDEVSLLAGTLCVTLINTLNPAMIVLGGKLVSSGTAVLEGVRRHVAHDLLSAAAEAVQIVPAALREDGVILGAAGLALYDLFKPSANGTAPAGYALAASL